MNTHRMRLIAAVLALAPLAGAFADEAPEEFVVGMGDYDTELNPYKAIYAHELQIFTALYEGLFTYDPETLEPVRAQADSFEKSADGKTWTFHIRDEARWSDGTSVTARDFVESWLYLLAPETKGEYAVFFDVIKGAKNFRRGKTKDASTVGIRAEGERTLVVELEAPAAYFTRLLCHGAFVPVHESLRYVRTWSPEDVVTNGPYTLASMDKESMLMKKSATYWDADSVALPAVRALFLSDAEEATKRYNDGEIHWLMDMADTDALLSDEAIQYAPMFATGYYFWNSSRKPWNDARVRRALALLVPWERIRTEENFYSPTSVLVLPFSGYVSPEGITESDEKEARRLLADAGYPGGKGLPTLRFLIPESETHAANADIMQEAWAALGITVETVVVPASASAREMRQEGFTLGFTSWIGDFADPAAFLLMWTSDSGLNEAGYKSREYDALVQRSMGEDGRARLQTLAKAEAKLLTDAALMPLYHSLSFNVVDTDMVTGWFMNPLDIHPFKTMGFGAYKAQPGIALLGEDR